MVRWFRPLLGRWLFLLIFMFLGSYLVLGWLDPPFLVARAAFIALFTSTLSLLPEVLARVAPATGARERPGSTSRAGSWIFYTLMLEAAVGVVLALLADSWEWRGVGIAAATVGSLLAIGVRTGRVQVVIQD